MGRDWLDPDSGYSFLAKAAAEARAASQKYWAVNTDRFPVNYLPSWNEQPRSIAAEEAERVRKRREGRRS